MFASLPNVPSSHFRACRDGDLFNPDNGYIYLADVFSNSVTVIDASTNTVIATITEPPNQTPRELAFDSNNGYIYVANVASSVSVIDGSTNMLLGSISTNTGIDGITYDSSNGNIYAVSPGYPGGGIVYVIDGSTNKVIGNIPVGLNPLEAAFDPDNGYIYVANEGSGSVSVIVCFMSRREGFAWWQNGISFYKT